MTREAAIALLSSAIGDIRMGLYTTARRKMEALVASLEQEQADQPQIVEVEPWQPRS